MAASNLPESCAFLTRSIMDFMQPHLVWRIATRDDDSIEAVGSNLVGISIGFDLGYTSLASVTLLRATANHHHPGPRRLHGSEWLGKLGILEVLFCQDRNPHPIQHGLIPS